MITTLTSREFNHDASGAKKAAARGPVIITDRGKPSCVLLSFEQYQKLTHNESSLAAVLAQHNVADFEFQPPRAGDIFRAAALD